MGNFDEAVRMLTQADIKQVIELVEEFYMLNGRWPTAAQIYAALFGT